MCLVFSIFVVESTLAFDSSSADAFTIRFLGCLGAYGGQMPVRGHDAYRSRPGCCAARRPASAACTIHQGADRFFECTYLPTGMTFVQPRLVVLVVIILFFISLFSVKLTTHTNIRGAPCARQEAVHAAYTH
jgi:hypothetical protein